MSETSRKASGFLMWDTIGKASGGIVIGLLIALGNAWMAQVSYRNLIETQYVTRSEFEGRFERFLQREAPYLYDQDVLMALPARVERIEQAVSGIRDNQLLVMERLQVKRPRETRD